MGLSRLGWRLRAADVYKRQGLAYVIVDTEHSPVGIESAAAQIAAAQGAGLTALARANEISRTAVLRLLDVGAQGVVVPCVETVDEVRELIQYAKFAPLGNRGFCPTRDGGWGHASHAASIPAYMETCNHETLLLPQCETVGCLEHIEEITAMDGVDGIFVGPFDLSIALGLSLIHIFKGISYIYGLGGRDVRVESIQHVFAELEKIAATGEVGETYRYLDVRE